MGWFINLLIAISILVVQHFLSTRKKAFWGGVMPLCFTVLLVYLKFSGLADDEKDFWFIATLGTVILLSIWAAGREKRRRQELDKMKSYDLK